MCTLRSHRVAIAPVQLYSVSTSVCLRWRPKDLRVPRSERASATRLRFQRAQAEPDSANHILHEPKSSLCLAFFEIRPDYSILYFFVKFRLTVAARRRWAFKTIKSEGLDFSVLDDRLKPGVRQSLQNRER